MATKTKQAKISITIKKPLYRFGRREFCAGLVIGAGAAIAGDLVIRCAWRKLPSDVDVVIVGAGAAGIGAALALDKAGLSYVIVEADKRVGGRALTNTDFFRNGDGSAIPFDIGCAWIHNYNQKDEKGRFINPFRIWAEWLKYKTHDDGALEIDALYYGKKPQPPDLVEKVNRDGDAIHAKSDSACSRVQDVAVSSVIDDWSPPMDAAATYAGPMDEAVDLDHLSTFDLCHLAKYDPNHLVQAGYGTLVKEVASYIHGPVVTGTPVTGINYMGRRVLVETAGENAGTITARAVIVTVSTGVMNSGAIRFIPPLSHDHQAAFANVPMGLLAKIPLLIPGIGQEKNPPKAFENILEERGGRQDIYFKAWPWDSDLMVGFVGGDFAWELSAAGESAAVDFAKQRLGDICGSNMAERVSKGMLTPWASNPFALGAYAMAKPGDFKSREIIKQSVNDRVFFAGEAMAPDLDGMFGTCSGAYNSGTEVAMKVAATLKPSA